jgi:glucose-1-phosphate adenylyltransferase
MLNAPGFVAFSFLQNVEDSDRSVEGFYIRSGITVIPKNSTIKDGTVV